MVLIFLLDHPANHFPHRDGRQFDEAFLGSRNTGVKKELQFEDALGAVEVFIGGHPADRGFMHLDVFGHVPENHGPQILHAMVKEGLLEFHNAFHHPCDGLVSLLNATNQPLCGAQFFI